MVSASLGGAALAPHRFVLHPVVPGSGEVAEVLTRVHRELLTGERATEPTVLPDEPPAPWEGVVPHGQGGEG